MRKKLVVGFILFWLGLSAFSYEPKDVVYANCSAKQEVKADCSTFVPSAPARNVIVFIGDGMGLNEIYAGRVFKNGPQQPLAIEDFPHHSLVKTCSLSGVTDSAASATALATGTKTYNGRLGIDPEQKPVENALELARKAGKAFGLVTTDTVLGGTPSGFALHEDSRSACDHLAAEYLSVKPELLMGGGRQVFKKNNLLEKAEAEGCHLVFDREGMEKTSSLPLFGLFAEQEMTFVLDRPNDCKEPTLAQMTKKALELLSQDPDGFFLMVEGGRIDHAQHQAKYQKMIQEVIALDEAVKLAKEFQAQHPDTLILLTADHETGGLKMRPGKHSKGTAPKAVYTTAIPGITTMHSAQKVALFGAGPGSELVEKASDNTQVFCIIKGAMTDHSEKTEDKGCGCQK